MSFCLCTWPPALYLVLITTTFVFPAFVSLPVPIVISIRDLLYHTPYSYYDGKISLKSSPSLRLVLCLFHSSAFPVKLAFHGFTTEPYHYRDQQLGGMQQISRNIKSNSRNGSVVSAIPKTTGRDMHPWSPIIFTLFHSTVGINSWITSKAISKWIYPISNHRQPNSS
jgi:hypothetical protein